MVFSSYFWIVDGVVMTLGSAMMVGSSIFAAVHNFRCRRNGSAVGFALMGLTFTCVVAVPLAAFIEGQTPAAWIFHHH